MSSKTRKISKGNQRRNTLQKALADVSQAMSALQSADIKGVASSLQKSSEEVDEVAARVGEGYEEVLKRLSALETLVAELRDAVFPNGAS